MDGCLEQQFLVDALEDAEVRWDTCLKREFPQDARAERVDCRDRCSGHLFLNLIDISQRVELASDALLHFGGRFLGEGDGDNLARCRPLLTQNNFKVAFYQHAGFARTGTCGYTDVVVNVECFLLAWSKLHIFVILP